MLKKTLHDAQRREQEAVFSAVSQAIDEEIALLGENISFIPTREQFERSLEKKRRACRFSYDEVQESSRTICSIINAIKGARESLPGRAGFAHINREILFLLRKALQEPLYLAFCEEEDAPITHFFHTLVLALAVDPFLLDAFYHIGKPFMQEIEQGHLRGHVKHARHVAKKTGLVVEDISLRYIWDNFYVAWGTFLSTTEGRRLVERFGLKKYDPRGDLGNNTGALFEMVQRVQGMQKKTVTRLVYTPSPTIGDLPAPELLALLQALENRHFMTPERLQNDRYPYFCWSYVNLQNIGSEHEGVRSYNLMKLNKEYPLSFRAITLAQDSQFYKAGMTRHAQDQKEDSALDDDYREKMKQELLKPHNWQLSHRQHRLDTGYFFECESWKKMVPELVDICYEVVQHASSFEEELSEKEWNWYQKAAFRELVHLAIISYHHAKTVRDCEMRSSDIHSSGIYEKRVLLTCACKESIDRGAKVSATLLWAYGQDLHEWHEAVFCALHGRALVTRRRLILHSRVEPLFALLLMVRQLDAKKLVSKVQNMAGVDLDAVHLLVQNRD